MNSARHSGAPRHDRRDDLVHAAMLSALAFTVHLAWETLQCPVFFVHGTYDATWMGMVLAALGDVLLTWVLYAVTAGVARRWQWSSTLELQHLAVLGTSAVAIAVFVELRALEEGRWLYRDLMPTVPFTRVGLVPIAQLVLLTPLVIYIAQRATQYATERRKNAANG